MGWQCAGVLQQPEDLGIGRLFWVTSDSIVAADLERGRIVLWNPAAGALFGYPAEEALGMPLLDLVPAELREAHLAGIERYCAGGEPVLVGGNPVEVPARTRSGDSLTVQLTLSDVTLRDERRHVVAVIRDVTELRRTEQELRRVNDAMRRFVATASHDLRTPLASVLGFARLLTSDGPDVDPAQRMEFAAAIERGADRAARLVDSLLTLSQIQAGVVAQRVEPVELAEAARDAVSVADVDAEVHVAEGLWVDVDPDLLHRALVNLVVNAGLHGAPPITVEADTRDGFVEIAVTDAGPGVAEDVVDRLFEPFARGDEAPSGGTGLGLSIVAGLAESWGGSAFYDPSRLGGARFGFRLPSGRPPT